MTVTLEPLSYDALTGDVQDMAVWLAAQLEGRYGFRPTPGRNQGYWLSRTGSTWRQCDASVPTLAVLSELEHAYYKLIDDPRVNARKLDRFTNRAWIEVNLLGYVRLLLGVEETP